MMGWFLPHILHSLSWADYGAPERVHCWQRWHGAGVGGGMMSWCGGVRCFGVVGTSVAGGSICTLPRSANKTHALGEAWSWCRFFPARQHRGRMLLLRGDARQCLLCWGAYGQRRSVSRGCTRDHRAELGVGFFPSHPQGEGAVRFLGPGAVPIPLGAAAGGPALGQLG